MHDGGGGSVVHDLGAVVEVVQVVTTIEAPKTKDVVQDQVLERERRTVNAGTDGQTGRRMDGQTHLDRPLLLGHVVFLEFLGLRRRSAHWRPGGSISVSMNRSMSQRQKNIHLHVKGRDQRHTGGAQTWRQHELHIGGLNS